MNSDRLTKALLAFVASGLWAVALRGGPPARAAAGSAAEMLRARRIEVVDASGRARAVIRADRDGPAVALYDPRGKARLQFLVDEVGPQVVLLDAREKRRLYLASVPHGPMVGLYDEGELMRMWHHLDSDGPAIFLRDEVGTLRAALGTTYLPPRPSGAPETTPASSLVLFGKDGKVVQRLP